MTRSSTAYVEAYEPLPPEKRPTEIRDFIVQPRSGTVKFIIRIIGRLYCPQLMMYVPRKPIKIYENGVLIGTATTWTSPSPGRFEFSKSISAPGSYEYYAEFEGDATYEGCEDKEELGW